MPWRGPLEPKQARELGPGQGASRGSPQGWRRDRARVCAHETMLRADGGHRPVRTLARIVDASIVGSPPDLRSWTVVRCQRSFLHRTVAKTDQPHEFTGSRRRSPRGMAELLRRALERAD